MLNSSKKIAELTEQLATATTALELANATIAERDNKISEYETSGTELIAAHTAAIEAKEAIITERDATIVELNGKVESVNAGFEERVTTEVNSRCAAAGVAPIARVENPDPASADVKPAAKTNLTGRARIAAAIEASLRK